MGPKHGVARGVAVFTSFESRGSDVIDGLLPESEGLRRWSKEHGVDLHEDSTSLEVLDAHLDAWNLDPSRHGRVDLSNEIGVYIGNVIVKHVAGSHWRVWPNGHPVVVLSSGLEMDVTSMVNDRLNRIGPSLSSLYAMALSD
jgi:hypothetical protein